MKINLTICGIHELQEHDDKVWTHVVSIWDRDRLDDVTCRKTVKEVAPLAKTLFCFFDDTENAEHPFAPRLQDIKRIMKFTETLPERHKLLVHCRAGVSRSTATAYAILCQHSKPGNELENLMRIELMRDLVMPNRLIIQHADKVLKREGALLLRLLGP